MNMTRFLDKVEFYLNLRRDLSVSEMLKKAYWNSHWLSCP